MEKIIKIGHKKYLLTQKTFNILGIIGLVIITLVIITLKSKGILLEPYEI